MTESNDVVETERDAFGIFTAKPEDRAGLEFLKDEGGQPQREARHQVTQSWTPEGQFDFTSGSPFQDTSQEPEPMLSPRSAVLDESTRTYREPDRAEIEHELTKARLERAYYESQLLERQRDEAQQQAAWEQQQALAQQALQAQQQGYGWTDVDPRGNLTQPSKVYWDEDGNEVRMPQYTPEQVSEMIRLATDEAISERVEWADQVQERQASEASIQEFYNRHPGVYGGKQDNAVYETVIALNQAWSDMYSEDGEWAGQLDIKDGDALDIAYEAAMNPRLAQVLMNNPHLIDDDAGMQEARLQAGMNPQIEQNPFAANDELSQAVQAYDEKESGLSDSVFGE